MTVLIIGAGVIGVTSAYFLAKSGHKVTVIDRQPVAANETSFANAGLIAPGHSYTWASPKAPGVLLRSLFQEGQSLRLKLRPDLNMWAWGLKFLKNCTTEKVQLNTARKVRLCRYSQEILQDILVEEDIDIARQSGGLLYVYRQQQDFLAGQKNMQILIDNGLDIQPINKEEVLRIEPAFEHSLTDFAGALYCPSDESGDANLFTRSLAERCAELGVNFLYEHNVKRILSQGSKIIGVETDRGIITADKYVLAAGSYSPILAKPIGYKLPIYPVKGYSITFPIEEEHEPPAKGGVDENNLVAWARFNNRFRLTATAEFAGYDFSHRPEDFRHMFNVAKELFPRAANYNEPSFWTGCRPMTPEGTPIISATRHENFYVNTGHGHMGWTMSCGSAKLLTSLINKTESEISLDGMAL